MWLDDTLVKKEILQEIKNIQILIKTNITYENVHGWLTWTYERIELWTHTQMQTGWEMILPVHCCEHLENAGA